MARVLVMYKTPKDAQAFDKYYFETHVPIAKRLPGLRKYEVSRGCVVSPAGDSGFHRIAVLHFDDMAAIHAAFASPEAGGGGRLSMMFVSKDDFSKLPKSSSVVSDWPPSNAKHIGPSI